MAPDVAFPLLGRESPGETIKHVILTTDLFGLTGVSYLSAINLKKWRFFPKRCTYSMIFSLDDSATNEIPISQETACISFVS